MSFAIYNSAQNINPEKLKGECQMTVSRSKFKSLNQLNLNPLYLLHVLFAGFVERLLLGQCWSGE